MENKLLFNSGSWAVGSEGKKAVVELGKSGTIRYFSVD
jgi:chemotaxis protein MotB